MAVVPMHNKIIFKEFLDRLHYKSACLGPGHR